MDFRRKPASDMFVFAKCVNCTSNFKIDVEINIYLNGPNKPLYGCSTLFNKMSKPGATTKPYFRVLQMSVSCVGFFYCVTILN